MSKIFGTPLTRKEAGAIPREIRAIANKRTATLRASAAYYPLVDLFAAAYLAGLHDGIDGAVELQRRENSAPS